MDSRTFEKRLPWLVLAAFLTLGPASGMAQTAAAPAGDKTFRFEEPDTVASTLKRLEGRVVKVRLAGNGEEISGKVQKVGKDLVHLSDLTGREFFDAVVRLDQISAVIVQARGR